MKNMKNIIIAILLLLCNLGIVYVLIVLLGNYNLFITLPLSFAVGWTAGDLIFLGDKHNTFHYLKVRVFNKQNG